ncbi:hypothetical protein JOE46_001072 [Rhodococcus sp. PvR099]|nr:hypothetical protein [Rhodococcus sp. PvR099]PTR38558.1 hypothetical protein C8K38_11743 [Rhodococcus sp. OK611]SNX92929.1 hypothetical protein SAMN05447004_11743 [Rhodococcus sp. OK270]
MPDSARHSTPAMRVLLVLACAVLAAAFGAPAMAARAAPAGPESPACAWRFMSNETVLNVAFPDANATYWVLPYALGGDDRIELSGDYPAARYFSLNTYGTDLNTVDTLRDDQIVPDRGSGNPFVDPSPAGSPESAGRWHATVVPGEADHALNQIRALPAGAASQTVPMGFLIIRVYVPDDVASPPGGVPLPAVALVLNNGATTIPISTCPAAFDPADATNGPMGQAMEATFDRLIAGAASGAFPGNVPEATFVNPASTSGLFPNGDNKYIGAGLTYQPGRIVVVRGRAPTFPDTREGVPVTEPGQQVRYWSMCQNDQVSPYPVVACAADFQTNLDARGYYTYVVAVPEDVPAAAASDPTVTVLPWGSTEVPKKVLFLRHMLPSPAFYPQSVQASQAANSDPATTMGEYYPRATYCARADFEAGGYLACLDGDG